ncbi:MAG TPA: hypothetical protein V6D33_02110 [Cyanophyceae cyanobacterium]
MKLDSRKFEAGVSQHRFQPWLSKSTSSTTELDSYASTWVKLRELPSPYSYEEALLLCQHSDTEWIVWIPDYGQMILHRSQFD